MTETMQCEACEGKGWRIRMIPHPGVPGCKVPATRICTFCQGKGTVEVIPGPSGKDKAANGTEEKELLFPS